MNITKKDVFETISECLSNMGVIVDIETIETEDVNLLEYELDSLAFVSFVVDLEHKLNIVIPDEYLTYSVLESLHGFANLIIQVLIDDNFATNTN